VYKQRRVCQAIHSLKNDYFRSKFEPELNKLRSNSGIGIISDWEAQPIIIHSHLGKFALAMVGKVANLAELTERALKKGMHFSEIAGKGINQTELVSMLIAEEDSFVSGIRNVFHHIKGSCSLLILYERGIFAARDKLGRTPVVIGKKDRAMAVSSESISFSNLGYSLYHSLGPGEIVQCTADAMEILSPSLDKMQICSFLWVYYGYPGSVYEGINVETCRYRCGAALAKNDTVEIDCAGGVPDSGTAHALGYSNERNVPHIRPFVKYTPTWPRSFMPQDQQSRDFIARMKLIPNRDLIEGKRLVICDDSIVRGTQLKDNARKLYDEGAGEVHLRHCLPCSSFPMPLPQFFRFQVKP
jgi:amidophosphoribosyltransferase